MKKKNVFKPENPLDFVISNVSYRGKDLVEMIGLNPKVSYELKVLFMKATEVVLKMQKEYQACTLEQQRIDLINNVDWRLRMFCDYVFSEHPDRKTYFLDQMMECINTSYDHLENNPNGIEIETSLPEEN